jgi:hypothetical protein
VIIHRLQRHPIPMTCHFEHSLVVTWAVHAETLSSLVPPGLALDTYRDGDDEWGFVVIAVVQTRGLRPRHAPAAIGGDFALTGYRIFVRHRDASGRERRGLHILRSDTDRRSMRLGGNLLTHYRYRLATIEIGEHDDLLDVRIGSTDHDADLHVVAHLDDHPAPLPPSSPFRSAFDARRFAGPLPWTFDHEPETGSIVMVHGRRSAWRPMPTAVEVETCTFFDRAPFTCADVRLASAFHVADLDYGWDRGVRVPIAAEAS